MQIPTRHTFCITPLERLAGAWSSGSDGKSRSGTPCLPPGGRAALRLRAGRHRRHAEPAEQPVHLLWPSQAYPGESRNLKSPSNPLPPFSPLFPSPTFPFEMCLSSLAFVQSPIPPCPARGGMVFVQDSQMDRLKHAPCLSCNKTMRLKPQLSHVRGCSRSSEND